MLPAAGLLTQQVIPMPSEVESGIDPSNCPACDGEGCSYCIEDRDEPAGIAVCDCDKIIMFGSCSDCGMSEEDLTFISSGGADDGE